MTTLPNPDASALMGALVGDAAALGLHWIYDPARIANVGGAAPAFTPLDPANYTDVMAFFAHSARKDGDLSQYGETLVLAMRSVQDRKAFDMQAYQTAYAAHFGAGGSYHGYIDRPTRGTLANLAAERIDPSGVDDDQLPALSTLPAIIARYRKAPDFHAQIECALAVTHVNAAAYHYALIFADLLADVLSGTALPTALETAAKREPLLQAALAQKSVDSTAYGEVTGRACHLHQGLPLAFHILARTGSFSQAITANIQAGGDSCGRAIAIGSLAGAAYGVQNIPLDWILATNDAKDHWSLAQNLSHSSE
ncbi:ADP-ribosylglycohydrolase family protein [Planktotalea arctica]|uniref:ADP-ribosylglycohydrolase family protein n=1 Tax=Planktotalea arctica TaxID=1481893 RepID=UPI003219C50A